MRAKGELTEGLGRVVLVYNAGVKGQRMPITNMRSVDAQHIYSLGFMAAAEESDGVEDVASWLAPWLKQL